MMMAIKKAPPPEPAPFKSETKLVWAVTQPIPTANNDQNPRTFCREPPDSIGERFLFKCVRVEYAEDKNKNASLLPDIYCIF